MDDQVISIFAKSLRRCTTKADFEERFYQLFLASSPKVAEKFAGTDFPRQKRALRASFHTMLLAVSEGGVARAGEAIEAGRQLRARSLRRLMRNRANRARALQRPTRTSPHWLSKARRRRTR